MRTGGWKTRRSRLPLCSSSNGMYLPHLSYVSTVDDILMQATGVEAADEVATSFNQFKLQREPHNHRYIIYVIKDNKIVVEKTGARDKAWTDFTADLPTDDCRYAVVDVDFETDDGRPTSKIIFLSWAPETAKVRAKMVYAGSKDAIKRALVGVGIHLNATDQSELAWDHVLPQVKKFT